MPFSFLAPLFLAAAAAIAIPIVVHLRRREQRIAIPFPSLMFLRRVPHRSTSRRQIQHWPLLLLRVLALIMIAAAFARPLLRGDKAAAFAGSSPARELVILLDRSYSMGTGDRFEQAKRVALDTIATLRPIDRASIVTFDAGARALMDPTADRARLSALVNETTVGDGATRYAPALKIASGILDASGLGVREVLLISDMQRIAWDGDPAAKLPPGAKLRTIAVTSDSAANLSLTEVAVERSMDAGRERLAPVARIANRGAAVASRIVVTLELDGRPAQTRTVDIPASGAANVQFEPLVLSQPARAVVKLPADGITADNEYSFLLAPGAAVRVALFGQSAASNLFLSEALALAEEPAFAVTEYTSGPTVATLKDIDVVVLNDVPLPAGPAGERMREIVTGGGGMIVALGERTSQGATGAVARALLPARPTGIVDRARSSGVPLGTVERSHPVFDIFRAPRSGDLLAARFLRHAQVDELAGDSVVALESDVLARFGDGGAALLERRIGSGRVLMMAAPLDNFWSDLPVQPVYLPLMHRMLLYAAGWEDDAGTRTVGDAFGLPAGEYVALTPAGKRVNLEGEHPVLPLEERGFYEVRVADGGAVVETVAANVDVAESDLSVLEPAALTGAIETPAGERGGAGRATDEQSAADRERTQSLWWYLMLAGFALLAAETVVSNYLSRRTVRREA